MIINDFICNVKNNPRKIAFIYQRGRKIYSKTYQDVQDDMFKVSSYLQSLGFKTGTKVLLFLKPSYEFYLLMIASLYNSYQVIAIDSFKDKELLKHMVDMAKPDYIVVNKLTKIIKKFFKPFNKIKSIDITKYKSYPCTFKDYKITTNPLLITFTSGSGGLPKIIQRTIDDLEHQFELVKKTIKIDDNVVLALLPIYVLANLIFGITSLLYSKKLNHRGVKELERLMIKTNTTSISASVSKYIKFTSPVPNIKKCYTGGSLISLKDALKIKEIFLNANFTYVYGASEAVLISQTNLDDYIANLRNSKICIGEMVEDIDVELKDIDKNGVGEICVRGKVVLAKEYHPTGDLGYVKDNKVYLVGRKKMSLINEEECIYNYQIEMEFLNNVKEIKKCVFLVHKGRKVLIAEANQKHLKSIQEFNNGKYEIILVNRMPVDIRHNYKVDYNKLIKLI